MVRSVKNVNVKMHKILAKAKDFLEYCKSSLKFYKIFISYLFYIYRVSKKIWYKPILEFLTSGGVFLGVKKNSKNFGNKKIEGCLAKF